MKILHLLKSAPDADTMTLVRLLSEGRESEEALLYTGAVDYDELVKKIFDSDQVTCWW